MNISQQYNRRNNLLNNANLGTYQDYLRSPIWKKIKSKTKQRDFWKLCNICGSDKNIHLHHFRYTKKMLKPKLSYLIPVCEDCHTDIHKLHKENPKWTIKKATRMYRKMKDC